MTLRTAWLPAGADCATPATTIGDGGSVVQSSLGQSSSVESYGGTWKLKMAFSKSVRSCSDSSRYFSSVSSSVSRGVSHGVGLL
jgi:hypothetical protein